MAEPGREQLIFPLDVPDLVQAKAWVDRLAASVGTFKVGLQLFIALGPEVARAVAQRSGSGIFLDLKLHDIPNTVEGAARSVRSLGAIRFLTAHAPGGTAMLEAAVRGAGSDVGVLGVTRLTSVSADPEEVVALALRSREAGCAGVVCAGADVAAVRQAIGPGMRIVVPGVRPALADPGDQVRVVTPGAAISAGADFVVVGRPIREAADPEKAATTICEEIEAARSG